MHLSDFYLLLLGRGQFRRFFVRSETVGSAATHRKHVDHRIVEKFAFEVERKSTSFYESRERLYSAEYLIDTPIRPIDFHPFDRVVCRSAVYRPSSSSAIPIVYSLWRNASSASSRCTVDFAT